MYTYIFIDIFGWYQKFLKKYILLQFISLIEPKTTFLWRWARTQQKQSMTFTKNCEGLFKSRCS